MTSKEYTRLAARISIARKAAKAKHRKRPATLKGMGIVKTDEYEAARTAVNAVLKPRPVGRPRKRTARPAVATTATAPVVVTNTPAVIDPAQTVVSKADQINFAVEIAKAAAAELIEATAHERDTVAVIPTITKHVD